MNRKNYIDIAKGIGIILVVAGHADALSVGSRIYRWIYIFHMALFFFISGYCYSDRHSDSWNDVITYIKSKIWRLYLPFVLVNFFYLIIDLIICYWSNVNYDNIHFKAIEIICFRHYENTFGSVTPSMWFIRVLFVASILWCLLLHIIKKLLQIDDEFLAKEIRIGIIILCILVSNLINEKGLDIPFRIDAIIECLGLYGIGYEIKQSRMQRCILNNNKSGLKILFSLCVTVVLSIDGYVDVGINDYSSLFALIIGGLAGWVLITNCALLIEKKSCISKILTIIGQKTFSILCFHIFLFKIITAIIYSFRGQPLSNLLNIYCIEQLWVLYSILSIALIVIVDIILDSFWGWMKNKIHY